MGGLSHLAPSIHLALLVMSSKKEAKERDVWGAYKKKGQAGRNGEYLWLSWPGKIFLCWAGLRIEHQGLKQVLEGSDRQPDIILYILSGPPLPLFSPFSSRLCQGPWDQLLSSLKIAYPALVVKEPPLICRIPEAWQVAVGIYSRSKPERSDSPYQTQAPFAAQTWGPIYCSLCHSVSQQLS